MSAQTWPPPVGDTDEWHEIITHHEYGRAPERTVVRSVRLWGKQVEIDKAGDVWCPHCRRFRPVAKLGHPWNSCPVGLPRRGGLITITDDEDAEAPSSPYVAGRGPIDFFQVPM